MNIQTFTNELAPLTYAQRMRRMVEIGRASIHDPELATLIQALRQGGTYERRLAMTSCFGSRDGNHALNALQDRSRTVRGMAIQLVALSCSDEQLHESLPTIPVALRYKVLTYLKKYKRQAPIDTYLRQLAAAGAKELAELLAMGSPEVVGEFLTTIGESASYTDWIRLAKQHPVQVTANLRAWAERVPYEDNRLKWIVNMVLPPLAERVPEQTLALVRAMTRTTLPGTLKFWELVRRLPRETIEFILQQENGLPADVPRLPRYSHGVWASSRAWSYVVPHLQPEQVVRLLEQYADIIGGGATRTFWFGKLPPAQRVELWQRFHLAWRDDVGTVPLELVQKLPQPFRTEEARRHVALAALQTEPARYLPYAGCLPWDEALPVVTEALKAQEGEIRVLAWQALAGVVRYERSRLTDLLAMMKARRFEQDPVRLAMIQGLAQMPAPAFHADHLADVAQLLKDGLDASDLSHATAQQMGELLLKLLPTYTDWAVQELTNLARSRGQMVSYRQRITQLPDSTARRLVLALMPVFNAWEVREREGPLLRFANDIDYKLKAVPEFLDIVERMVTNATHSQQRVEALNILLRHDRPRAARLIPELLVADGSWMTRYPVYTYIHQARQDLLTPYLGQTSYQGRFSTGKTRFVLPFVNGFFRWTPEQQSIFSRVLVEVVGDKQRDTPAVLTVIRQLSQLLYIEPTRLIRFASDEREPVKAAALRALGRYDAGQGIPTLLEALNDERARYAIYALRRALLEMPADQARQILNQVPYEKVTVAKEVLRLLGELKSEEAYQDLLMWDTRDLHRDVRVALVRALWDHLERDETWAILERAAHSEEYAIAAITARTPALRLSPQAQQRLLGIIATLLRHPNVRVRQRTLERLNELPVADPNAILLQDIEKSLFSNAPDEVKVAATALFTTYALRDVARLVGVVEQLIPSRQALKRVMDVLAARVRLARDRFRETTQAVLGALQQDPLTGKLQSWLIMSGFEWNEIHVAILQLLANQGLTHDVVKTVEGQLSGRVQREQAEAAKVERQWAAHEAPVVRYLGLLLLQTLGTTHGWSDARIAALNTYRQDRALMVAGPAQFIFWKGEESP